MSLTARLSAKFEASDEIVKVAYMALGLCSFTIIWDHFALKVPYTVSYFAMKLPLLFFLVWPVESKIQTVVRYRHALFFFFAIVYSTIGMIYIHPSYYFAFLQFYFASAVFCPFGSPGYRATFFIGIFMFALSLFLSRELDYVKEGMTAKPDIAMAMIMVFFASWALMNIVAKMRAKTTLIREQFASLGKSSSFLVHEIKSPLERVRQSAKNHQVPAEFLREFERLYSVLTTVEILAFKKSKTPKQENVLLLPKIEAVADNLKPLIENWQISLKVQIPPAQALLANSNMLELLLKNLLKNSIEAVVALPIDQRTISISSVDGRFSVVNPYRSSAPLDARRLVEPGFTTKSNLTNQGIGLTLCKEVCELMGWKLDLKITDGQFCAQVQV